MDKIQIKTTELISLSKEELLAIILRQSADIDILVAQNSHQQAHITEAESRIVELEQKLAQLSKNSTNSSKPPSTDLTRPGSPSSHHRNSRTPSGRRPGGQPGRLGVTRQPVANPDEVVACAPDSCTICGKHLEPTAGESFVATIQVVDIPGQLHFHFFTTVVV